MKYADLIKSQVVWMQLNLSSHLVECGNLKVQMLTIFTFGLAQDRVTTEDVLKACLAALCVKNNRIHILCRSRRTLHFSGIFVREGHKPMLANWLQGGLLRTLT